jgi:Family of unknown function (DUF6527)
MDAERLEPSFVELMPPMLEPGTLYISTTYRLTTHLCACGCGEKIVLPLHPQQWRITYDGASVSMHPSVGNVGMACKSHYWIRDGHILWAPHINEEQARQGKKRDREDLLNHQAVDVDVKQAAPAATGRRRLWAWLRRKV